MRPYTMDLRERVAAAMDDGLWSQLQIARLFRVSVSFVTQGGVGVRPSVRRGKRGSSVGANPIRQLGRSSR